MRELVLSERVTHGREPETASVKNTDTAEKKGYDGWDIPRNAGKRGYSLQKRRSA